MPASTRRFASPLLFKWESSWGLDSQNRLWALSGNRIVTATFDRGGTVGAASAVDANGRSYVPGYKTPRWHHTYDSTEGLWLPRGLLLEGARKHVCLQGEDWSTTWAAVGTPTRVAASDTASGVSLDTIGDDDAGVLEGYTQTVAFTGDATKAVSLFVKAGTSASSVIRLRDTSAGANRLLAAITWTGSVPTATMTTGTYVGVERMKGDVYLLLFTTTAVTAANTNSLEFYPATDAALATTATGTIIAGGMDAEDGTFPSRYCKTTTVAITRSADALSFAFNAAPQAMTVYVKFTECGASYTAADGVVCVGDSGNASWFIASDAGHYRFLHRTAITVESAAAASPALGDGVELRAVLAADGSVLCGQSLNAATEAVGAWSGVNALATSWYNATLRINDRGTGASFNSFQSVRIAAGVQTMAYMRAA